jgi:hypothetical protein
LSSITTVAEADDGSCGASDVAAMDEMTANVRDAESERSEKQRPSNENQRDDFDLKKSNVGDLQLSLRAIRHGIADPKASDFIHWSRSIVLPFSPCVAFAV